MELIARVLRYLTKLRFRLLKLATIKDIPTDKFNSLIEELLSSDWRKTYVYKGFDAWIDYGKIKFKKDGIKLTLEWDNWSEGSVEGPIQFIKGFAKKHNLAVTHEWRWAEYDKTQP